MLKLKEAETKTPRRKRKQRKAQVQLPTKTSVQSSTSNLNRDEETIVIQVVSDPIDPDVLIPAPLTPEVATNNKAISYYDTVESEMGKAQLPGSSMEQNTDGF